MNVELDSQRRRAVELGNSGEERSWEELCNFLKSGYPAVRRAAASALGKMIDRFPSLAEVVTQSLASNVSREDSPQVLHYMLKTLLKCAQHLNLVNIDDLMDIARDPNRPDYVRTAANEVIAASELAKKDRQSILRHWCSRCRKTITPEESKVSSEKYGKPYCWHCFHEKQLEDVHFSAEVEEAKRLRTVDEVAVQSRGEQRIGNWLAKKGIAYSYDERVMIVRDTRIRPDFYLPEFDLYIEYWGMNTPEYIENMRHKKILYQKACKKLISISFKDFDKIEQILEEKLAKYGVEELRG